MTKPISIDWCPKDALDGMQQLGPWEELAYRRILDLIYVTNDELYDDERLGWMTKTGNRWPNIKKVLVERGKIYLKDGLIRNQKCSNTLDLVRKRIQQKRDAGKARQATANTLEINDSTSAAAGSPQERKDQRHGSARSAAAPALPRAPVSNQQPAEKETPPDGGAKKLEVGIPDAVLSDPRKIPEFLDRTKGNGHARTRGTRIAADWWPDEQDCEFARSLGIPLKATALKFRDYWLGKAGKEGIKLDWKATWRNKCRNDAEKAAERLSNRPGAGGVVTAARELMAEDEQNDGSQ